MKDSTIIATEPFPPGDKVVAVWPWLAKPVRHYLLQSDELGHGYVNSVFYGFPCDENNKIIEGAPKIVAKIPKIDLHGKHTGGEISSKMHWIRTQCFKEFTHVRTRLLTCDFANPIIDYGSRSYNGFELIVTIQPYLDPEKTLELEKWLEKNNLRQQPLRRNNDGKEIQSWSGVSSRVHWSNIALKIATAIKDIHLHRVRHGDIHPGNIFLRRGFISIGA
jgi:hypothetical protein